MRPMIPSLVLTVLFTLGGCGGSSSPGKISRTTIGDTLIVANTPPEEDPPSLYRFERELIIGVAEGEEPYMLVSSGNLAVDDEGRIYTGHQPDGEVRVFGPDGTFLRRFGRRGEGPGEFSANTSFGIRTLAGGLVAVEDIPFQMEIFNDQGHFQRAVDLRMLPIKAEKEGYFSSSVTWIAENTLFIPWRRFRMGEDSHHWFLLTDEELESRIWIDAGSSPSSIWVDGPGFYSIPYPPLLDWTITGNGVVVWGINREYRLTRYDVVNDSWMQIVFERTPVPFTSQDRHRYIEAELADYPAERRASRETALLRMPYPDHYPWFTGIWGDDEGNIWVCRYIERYWQPRPEGYRYELFNARGEWQGIVGTPRLFSVIRGGYAYVSGWEEYPTIERYRMIRNR